MQVKAHPQGLEIGEKWRGGGLSAPCANHGITPKYFFSKLQFFKSFPFFGFKLEFLQKYNHLFNCKGWKIEELDNWTQLGRSDPRQPQAFLPVDSINMSPGKLPYILENKL